MGGAGVRVGPGKGWGVETLQHYMASTPENLSSGCLNNKGAQTDQGICYSLFGKFHILTTFVASGSRIHTF